MSDNLFSHVSFSTLFLHSSDTLPSPSTSPSPSSPLVPPHMVELVVSTVVNIEPHHFEAKFKKRYRAVTAKDVLDQAKQFLKRFSSTREPTRSFNIGTKKTKLVLRYIVKVRKVVQTPLSSTHDSQEEDVFAVNSKHKPGNPLSEDRLSRYTLAATEWYRTTGYNLSSAVPEDCLLSSIAQSPDSKRVR